MVPELGMGVCIVNEIIAFLKSRSAEKLEHVHGDLVEHLAGTYALVREWGNPPDVCHAALCHTVYGTDGFSATLLDVNSEREDLVRIIGSQADELDILGKDQRLVEQARPNLGALFRRCGTLVSEPAFVSFVSLFGEPALGRV